MITKRFRRLTFSLINWQNKKFTENELAKSSFFFAPHFDDEVLACGGLVMAKSQVGAKVKMIYMTDGSKSHKSLITEKELATLRQQESVLACEQMGVEPSDMILLNYEETQLKKYEDEAIDLVAEFLITFRPEQIFIPHHNEPNLWSEDHQTTNRIARSAVKKTNIQLDIYEYPVWLWCVWPWAHYPKNGTNHFLSGMSSTFISLHSLLFDFKKSIHLLDLNKKKLALKQYKTQMIRYNGHQQWKTLSDVAKGQFLTCFYQNQEIFHLVSQKNG